MKKILISLLLIYPFNLQAGSMNGIIQVSLTIMPSPCIATSTEKMVTVDCGNLKNNINTVIEKQIATDNDKFLVTITY